MKPAITVLFAFLSLNAFSYEFECMGIEANLPYGSKYVQIETTAETVTMYFEGFDEPEIYTVKNLNQQDQFGKDRMELTLFESNSDFGESPKETFFGDLELLTGGYPLHTERTGGFMRTLGYDGEWVRYICERD